MRQFETGATRDTSKGKLEYTGFLDARTLRRYAQYMHKFRRQPDGNYRDPDNWKKGIPLDSFMSSLFRHVMDVWEIHEYGESRREETGELVDLEEAICGVIFNAHGYLFEHLKNGSQLAEGKQVSHGERSEGEHASPIQPGGTTV
jgi:hypothetical protein